MDDEQSLLAEPTPVLRASTAAEAFARLEAQVASLDGRVAMMARALEHIAIERHSIEVPDYSSTLGKIGSVLTDIGKRLKAIEQSPALEITPESMADRITEAASAAREIDRATIRKAQELQQQTNADSNKVIGRVRTRTEHRRQLLCCGLSVAIAVSLLDLVYPGWTANLGPRSWHWPERVAGRALGEVTMWDAGVRMMRTDNPEGWQTIVDAAEMRRANHDSIDACERSAAKASAPVQCMIKIERSRP